MDALDELKYDQEGLIPAVIQDQQSGQVLMVAHMNRTSVQRSLETGKTHFWSRSRQQYWMKGEQSGHVQWIKAIYTDCDADVLLVQVEQVGAACHEGYWSCFFRRLEPPGRWKRIAEQVFDPQKVYKSG